VVPMENMAGMAAGRAGALDGWPVISAPGVLVALVLAGCAAPPAVPEPAPARVVVEQPRPPAFRITRTDRFDAAEIAAYAGDHPDVYAYIDRHRAEHLENLRRWLRQPSISAEGVGIREMAELLRDDLLRIGFQEAELVPTSGHPGVWGYYDAGADRTLVVYMMYDVQPIEPEGWQVPAFEARLVDHPHGRAVMARGATNQKGPQRAFLNAVEAIVRTTGGLPVNLMIAAEGEEELGSPHYEEIIDRYEARLRSADGVFFPFNSQAPDGSVGMFLGVKGIVYFEMEAQGGPHGGPQQAEIHGSYKVLVDSPVWRLAQALASLTSDDGNTILVPGYYDAIRPPSPEEQRLAAGMLPEWRERERLQQETFGVARWIDGLEGEQSLMRAYFGTTLNINGIWGGYTGPGVKTILPHRATAKVDSRLVPDQTPEEALRLIRAHLDDRGFTDIEVRRLGGYPPAQSSVEAPLVQAAIAAYNKHGLTPSVAPRIFGSAPYYVFTERLGLPTIAGGLGHGSGAHAPNEYMIIEPRPGSGIADLARIEKFYVDLLHALAEADG
jgi:acetylornithine deacetylase/succinyl-diaminopimelate desuccinylase-like protein